mgnify:CR=1 FL=1
MSNDLNVLTLRTLLGDYSNTLALKGAKSVRLVLSSTLPT